MNEFFSQGGKGSTGILTNKQAIARTYNVKVSEVIYSNDVVSSLGDKKIIYDKTEQYVWQLPSGMPADAKIISVSGDILTYAPGPVSVTLQAITTANVVKGELDAYKEVVASVYGSTQVGHATYNQLRAYTGSGNTMSVIARTNVFDGASGLFAVDTSDSTSLDNDGTCLVDAIGRRWKRVDTETVKPEWWGASADGVSNASVGINAAIKFLKDKPGLLKFGRGVYLCNSVIDLKGCFFSIRGEGIQGTRLTANFTGETFVDLYETVDARISPITISDLTIDGAFKVNFPMRLRYRHYTKFTNVLFTSTVAGSGACAYLVDAWLNTFTNCGFESGNFGLHLDGANHRSAFYSCSFQGCTNRCIVVRDNATAADGNTGLYFANCDVEFSDALGIDFQGTDATFNCCYLGENLSNSVIQIYSGTVRINGGVIFFGYTALTNLAYMTGGTLIIDGASINGQTYGSLTTLAGGNGAGKLAIKNSPLGFPLGGDPTMISDVLLSLNDKKVFAPRLGIDYAGYGFNATVTESVTGSSRTITASTVPGPSPIVGLRADLTDMEWRDGEPWAAVVTYSSNSDFKVRVASAALGSGTVIGSLPNTGGAVKTAVLYTTLATRTEATVIEVYLDEVVSVGHTLTLHKLSLGDSRAMGKEFGANGGNIYLF